MDDTLVPGKARLSPTTDCLGRLGTSRLVVDELGIRWSLDDKRALPVITVEGTVPSR